MDTMPKSDEEILSIIREAMDNCNSFNASYAKLKMRELEFEFMERTGEPERVPQERVKM